jgi:hypothetical protein
MFPQFVPLDIVISSLNVQEDSVQGFTRVYNGGLQPETLADAIW